MLQPIIGILALQGGIQEHAHMVTELGVQARLIRRPEHLQGIDGLILPGGESTTMSKLLDISGLRQPVYDLIHSGIPTFGTCAGLILLANKVLDTRPDAQSMQALDVTVRRNAFGRQSESFETTLPFSFAAIEEKKNVDAVFIRAPWIEEVGENVHVLSTLPDGTIVAVQERNILGTSFHPELTQDTTVHEYFLSQVHR